VNRDPDDLLQFQVRQSVLKREGDAIKNERIKTRAMTIWTMIVLRAIEFRKRAKVSSKIRLRLTRLALD